MMRTRLALAVALLLPSRVALAHDEHPHPPGSPEYHAPDQPAPAPDAGDAEPGPEVTSENLPTDDSPPPKPTSAEAPRPLPDPPPTTKEGWRPRTIADSSWRQAVRDEEESEGSRFLDALHFLVELRFGPYWPKVDDEPGLTGAPYERFFGDDPQFYFGVEVDWLPLYLPYVGSLGPSIGWGVTIASGNAKIASRPTEDAGSETDLTIFPMHVSAAFRAEGLLRELNVPIVPYVKAGFGFAPWLVDNPNATAVEAEGTSYGLHLALGGAIALNAFDPNTARAMREDVGIRYAYLWGEWMYNPLGTFTEGQMYVGTSTVVVGLAVDF